MTILVRHPARWATAPLASLSELRLGKMLDKGRPKGRPFAYLRNINIRWDAIDTSDLSTMCFEDDELERYGIRDGDLLVCEGGEPGRAAVWAHGPTDLKYQKALHRVRLAAGIVPRWVMFQLMLDAATGGLARSFTGSTIAHLPGEKLAEYVVRVASNGEQQRIVEALDSYLSRLDSAVASLQKVQTKLKAYRASVLKAAVEGRLVPTEAEIARREGRDYEPASVLLARILKERRRRWEEAELARMKKAGKTPKDDAWKRKYEEPEAPDTSKLPSLPEGWCWATMAALIADGPQNGLYVPQSRYGDGFPILRIDDFQAGSSRSSHELQRVAITDSDADHYALRDGDMVINRVNSMTHLGKALAIEGRHRPAVFESNMMRFSLAHGVEPRYLWAYLCSSDGKARLTKNAKWAVNQASINQKDVAACAVPLPPSEEQLRILSELDRLLSAVAATSAGALRNQLRSHRLRQSVLKWAFEGKLVDQDPSDEPAEELLARIRAEREATPTTKTRGRKAKSS